MALKNLFCIFLVVIICGFATAYAVDIEPSDDMTTDPDQHYIPDNELWTADFDFAGHHERISIKFDLDDYMGQQIDSAYLNIYRFYRCPNHYHTITSFYHITQPWDESTWPQNVHSPHAPSPWLIYNFGPHLGWYRIEITSLVQAWLNGDMVNCGLVIQAQYGEKFSKFYSKEASSNVRPYLEINGTTGIDEKNIIPEYYKIQAYPNPFNATTTISYTLPYPSDVTLDIYDILGRKLETLIDTKQPAGSHSVIWNADGFSSGVYFYKLTAGEYKHTQKMMLLK